jgi:NAD(P)-dependent dehydrogenase (short-subunit alcohol dehydrogenase family)
MKIDSAEAIVTGAARGLGRYFALALAREGARVVAADVNPAGLRSLKAEAAGLSGSLTVATVDIPNESEVVAFVDSAARELAGSMSCSTMPASCGTAPWWLSSRRASGVCPCCSGARWSR